uniref:Virulence associated protein E n=1 Tax=Siphoviridae sp. ctgmM3 TaxID=2827912 RepID=A0A8S5TKY3_9CAUD|nr:MAG TPA: virulence associated protein E [Siphoviridae sp. ctgmM3]
MRELAIAYGNNRQTKRWINKSIKYDVLKDRLKVTIRTTETVEEYRKMSKAQRDTAKDHGGFVGGVLKGGRRKVDTVEKRSMIALDGDRIDKAFLEDYENLVPFTSCLYTTHSSTVEEPRVRLIFPLLRDISSEEFVAVSRYLAQELGIDMFDECSYQPNQLMYWPSTPQNGSFVFKEVDKEWLNPDDILSAHPEWRDPTQLPTSSRESKANQVAQQKVMDPLEKEGTVGFFNRAYFPISKALDTFLSDVYEATDNVNRYHLIDSHSIAGVEIKEDKFVYSHHAKDPAYMKLCNAFDIVRIHKFGDLEDKHSFQAMCDFAMQQDKVKILAANERLSEAELDFTNSKDDENWKAKLKYQPRTGILENSVYNLNLILAHDPDFQHFAFNEMANRIQITGELPWERPEGNLFWRDADTAQLKSIIDIRYLPFSSRNHDVAFVKIADDRHFYPIRDYLNHLPPWDKVKRVEDLFIKYLQAEDTEYVRTVTKKTFAAAVARILVPGTKFDCVLVLDGDQGIGKSSIVKDIVTADYYSETLSLTDMDDKSGAEKLQGFWIVEIGELAGMKKADIEKVKAFLSTSDDKYRPSYGKVVESHPRQCIIIATVNGERGYLRDITGNRRFWIVKVQQKKQKKNWNFDEEFRAQFWAEAKEIWLSGEKLYLEGEVLLEAEKEQRNAMEADERVGMIEEYLNRELPDDWDSMDLFARRNYLSGTEFGTPIHNGCNARTEVSNAEIWCECFGKNLQELKPSDSYGIAAMMAQISDWERSATIRRQPIYGRQRIYLKRK